MSTEVAVRGNALFPGVGDWYLGCAGYVSLMTAESEDAGRSHNLDEPLPGDWGAHGRFDDHRGQSEVGALERTLRVPLRPVSTFT